MGKFSERLIEAEENLKKFNQLENPTERQCKVTVMVSIAFIYTEDAQTEDLEKLIAEYYAVWHKCPKCEEGFIEWKDEAHKCLNFYCGFRSPQYKLVRYLEREVERRRLYGAVTGTKT